jgi:hypothetical protein
MPLHGRTVELFSALGLDAGEIESVDKFISLDYNVASRADARQEIDELLKILWGLAIPQLAERSNAAKMFAMVILSCLINLIIHESVGCFL